MDTDYTQISSQSTDTTAPAQLPVTVKSDLEQQVNALYNATLSSDTTGSSSISFTAKASPPNPATAESASTAAVRTFPPKPPPGTSPRRDLLAALREKQMQLALAQRPKAGEPKETSEVKSWQNEVRELTKKNQALQESIDKANNKIEDFDKRIEKCSRFTPGGRKDRKNLEEAKSRSIEARKEMERQKLENDFTIKNRKESIWIAMQSPLKTEMESDWRATLSNLKTEIEKRPEKERRLAKMCQEIVSTEQSFISNIDASLERVAFMRDHCNDPKEKAHLDQCHRNLLDLKSNVEAFYSLIQSGKYEDISAAYQSPQFQNYTTSLAACSKDFDYLSAQDKYLQESCKSNSGLQNSQEDLVGKTSVFVQGNLMFQDNNAVFITFIQRLPRIQMKLTELCEKGPENPAMKKTKNDVETTIKALNETYRSIQKPQQEAAPQGPRYS